MKGRHRRTLEVVFHDPVPGSLQWVALEGLLTAAGARVIEGRGSRVRFEKDGEVENIPPPSSLQGGQALSGSRRSRLPAENRGHAMTNTMTFRGYSALIAYDDEDGIFTGRIAGIRDGVGFHAGHRGILEEGLPRRCRRLHRNLCEGRQGAPESLFGPDDVPCQSRSSPQGRSRGGAGREEPEPVGRGSVGPSGALRHSDRRLAGSCAPRATHSQPRYRLSLSAITIDPTVREIRMVAIALICGSTEVRSMPHTKVGSVLPPPMVKKVMMNSVE